MGSHAQTRHAKVRDALHRVGASVFNGAFSTFLAVVAMANSQTYVFRVFFKQFFLVTLIGSAHGLLVLPVLLELFGPTTRPAAQVTATTTTDDGEKEDKEAPPQTKTTQMAAVAPSHSDMNHATPVPSSTEAMEPER